MKYLLYLLLVNTTR